MEREFKILQIEGEKLCGLCLDREVIHFKSVVVAPAEMDEKEITEKIAVQAQKLHCEECHQN